MTLNLNKKLKYVLQLLETPKVTYMLVTYEIKVEFYFFPIFVQSYIPRSKLSRFMIQEIFIISYILYSYMNFSIDVLNLFNIKDMIIFKVDLVDIGTLALL